MSAADSYQVWTDGACSKNPGEGGWAFVIHQQQEKGKIQEIHKSGYSDHTTNNIMEMTAAIKALENLPLDSNVTLYTDSQYLQKGIVYHIIDINTKPLFADFLINSFFA